MLPARLRKWACCAIEFPVRQRASPAVIFVSPSPGKNVRVRVRVSLRSMYGLIKKGAVRSKISQGLGALGTTRPPEVVIDPNDSSR